MTIAINGTAYNYLNQAVWQTSPAGQYLSGNQAIRAQRLLTLTGDVMTTTEYDAITALEGTQVSVTACGYDIDADVTYYDCVIDSVTGTHTGPNMLNVSVVVKVARV